MNVRNSIPDFRAEPAWVTPWDGLLLEVRRSAYRVEWVDARIAELLVRERQLVDEDEFFGGPTTRRLNAGERAGLVAIREELREWLKESRNERKHLAAVCERAIRAGFVERSLQLAQLEAKTIARVLGRSLEPLNLDGPQRDVVARAMREALEDVSTERRRSALTGASGNGSGPGPG